MKANETIKILQEHLVDQWNKSNPGDRQRLVLEWIKLKEEAETTDGAGRADRRPRG